jgi:two-component sensor histidine kinase
MRLTDRGSLYAVQESKQRVQAMALIHQRLYKTEEIARINMKDYITELADFLAVSYGYGPHNFSVELDIEEEWVDIDKALPIGLILNELLTNAFKYAYAGSKRPARLTILFKRADGNFTLVVKDNGKGIRPGEWNNSRNTSFGRQLVEALCGQLRAKETLEVADGTSFIFSIPEAA